MSQKVLPLPEAVAQNLQITSAALEKAAAIYQQHENEKAAVSLLIPETVKAALDSGLIEPSEARDMAAALLDHGKAVVLLKHAASRARGESPSLPSREVGLDGRAGREKKASASNVPIGYGSGSSQASEDFDRAIGLTA